MEQVSGLIEVLNSVHFCDALENRQIWKLERFEMYSCTFAFKVLTLLMEASSFSSYSFIWKAYVTHKVIVSSWLLLLGNLDTHDVLQKRMPCLYISLGRCVLCKEDNESLDHLFLHCRLALAFWSSLLKEFEVYRVLPPHCSDIFQIDGSIWGSGSWRKKLWNVAVIALCWSLWLERNIRTFENVEGTVESV